MNASLEIARRGYQVIILKTKQFYPVFSLKDRWKKHFEEVEDWKKLFKVLKNSKVRYRVSLEECKVPYKVFQFYSIKSKVKCYNFAK